MLETMEIVLAHLVLFGASIKRKRHESVMSLVMKRRHMSRVFDLMISMTSSARPESISFFHLHLHEVELAIVENQRTQDRLRAGLLFCDPISQTFDKIAL